MKNSDIISASIYICISLLAAGIFVIATLSPQYSNVDRFGGAAWVFILSMIILMPVIIPFVKKR
ncbi:MAG: hypothetical protein ABSG90_09415 [Dehalococcoidia bacterium]|jgi:hypothetical protein